MFGETIVNGEMNVQRICYTVDTRSFSLNLMPGPFDYIIVEINNGNKYNWTYHGILELWLFEFYMKRKYNHKLL